MNIALYDFCWTCVYISFDIHLWVGSLGHMIRIGSYWVDTCSFFLESLEGAVDLVEGACDYVSFITLWISNLNLVRLLLSGPKLFFGCKLGSFESITNFFDILGLYPVYAF